MEYQRKSACVLIYSFYIDNKRFLLNLDLFAELINLNYNRYFKMTHMGIWGLDLVLNPMNLELPQNHGHIDHDIFYERDPTHDSCHKLQIL